MSASLHVLLAGAIDYAGLFPPAQLPLEQAIRNYARYRAEPEGWMLGRFICPAARLQELTPLVRELFEKGPPLAISALGRGGASAQEFRDGMKADLEAIATFEAAHGPRVRVDVLETRLPPLAVFQPELGKQLMLDALGPASLLIETQRRSFLTPVYEIDLGPNWRESLLEVAAAFVALDTARATAGHILCLPTGLKLRCGGGEASAVPAPEQVAYVLLLCRETRVVLKATAGLHHPIRHFDQTVQAPMHGFINLFCAAVLAHVHGLTEAKVRAILEDEDSGHFALDDQGLRWNDLRATTDQIRAARQVLLTSFGSCSFDEPREDLRALGWLK